MELCNIQKFKELMVKHGFSFSKSLGQNFLIDPSVPEKIADGAGLDRETAVLEIGPGIGSLTRALSLRAGEVCAVEIDRALSPILAETLSGYPNASVFFGDILDVDLPSFIKEHFSLKNIVAVSNLPYYITTKTITALLESGLFRTVTVMLQREAAKKLTALPGDADWCLFSVIVNHYASVKKLFNVPPGSFYPMPKVDSVVLRLDTNPVRFSPEKHTLFISVARAAFISRRKTIQNNLSAAFSNTDRETIFNLLTTLGIEPTRRGESLTLTELYGITQGLMQIIQSK